MNYCHVCLYGSSKILSMSGTFQAGKNGSFQTVLHSYFFTINFIMS